MLAQLIPPSVTATAAIITAAIAGTLAIIKKLLPHKENPKPDNITRAEFHQGIDALRDKIETLGTSIHAHLAHLESAVARLDERTQIPHPAPQSIR